MTSTSFLVLLFVVVPGFIADATLRSLFGQTSLTDFERTVRSLILSIIGLLVYLTVVSVASSLVDLLPGYAGLQDWMLLPPYLTALGGPSTGTVNFSGTTLWPFLAHSASTVFAGVCWGRLMSTPWVERLIANRTGRAVRGTAWQLLWNRYNKVYAVGSVRKIRLWKIVSESSVSTRIRPLFDKTAATRWLAHTWNGLMSVREGAQPIARMVTVRLVDGLRITGYFQAASDDPEERDVIIASPWIWDETKEDWHAEGTRYLYIPADQILFISLAPAGDESAPVGYYKDLKPVEASHARS